MSVTIIFGAAGFPSQQSDDVSKEFSVLKDYGVKDLDTAHLYV